jgi:nitrate reductase gamma subunit
MEAFLNAVAPIALAIFVVGIGLRFERWFKALVTKRKARGVTANYQGGPSPISMREAFRAVVVNPVTHFYSNANRTWSRGYVLYHMAIITEVVGYSLAALILFIHIILGNPVPDVAAHAAQSWNYSPANLLAIVFGNGEHLQSHFLFGGFAPFFVGFTWIAVVFAVAGNLHMMYTALRKRNGAITGAIDPAAKDVRIKGKFMLDRLVVRGLIFTIIWTELLARLEVVEGIVFVHAFLALTLLTILPFTYLFHMVYNFLAIFYATRRRMARTIA